MDDADEDGSVCNSDPTTPVLSPTKSTSTYGWTSPVTPSSPRKTRSCLLFRDWDTEASVWTPPPSPTKHSFGGRLEACRSQWHSPRKPGHATLPQKDGSDIEHELSSPEYSPVRPSNRFTRLNYRSAPDGVPFAGQEPPFSSKYLSLSNTEKGTPPSPEDAKADPPYPVSSDTDKGAPSEDIPRSPKVSAESVIPQSLQVAEPHRSDVSLNRLNRLPLRCSSSPLRPSQWTSRGGYLSTPRPSTRMQDRFIPARRPHNVTRESFELNKPVSRLTPEEKITRGASASTDAFSRRLHRSGRMNEELQTLRETHSVLTGRANLSRPGGPLSIRRNSLSQGVRQVSTGAVWNVGGSSAASDTVGGVSDGRGGILGTGTNAPLYSSMFLSGSDPEAELETYERRLALAFDIDQADRVLGHLSTPPSSPTSHVSSSNAFSATSPTRRVWKDNAWTREGRITPPTKYRTRERKPVPILPFRVLDAPQLRDDYYCSLLAYSKTAKCLAVGLGNYVHLWSERDGVDTPESLNATVSANASDIQHVTALAFSSTQGGHSILAVGRADGHLLLWSPSDSEPRFNAEQPRPISCVSFRPTVVKRPSLRDRMLLVSTEELLIGDEAGHIYFYSVEWPNETDSAIFGWHGALTLLARMTMHAQQICGLSWSIDGELFASGGNDNACFLFETRKILQHHPGALADSTILDRRRGSNGENVWTVTPGRDNVLVVDIGREKHRWELNAAVKAIAFCPWQRGLLAVGGGSNDRCIHFYHTVSGACLATIDCAAQVTSLIWSTTRREIAATFGFAQPEHPYRVAVFAWPSCEQIVSIPWYDENRALYAVAYPGCPSTGREKGEDGTWWSRGAEEGCIVVAASDAAIRFHEIWTEDRKGLGSGKGMLGGSEILESLHGIERDGDQTIR